MGSILGRAELLSSGPGYCAIVPLDGEERQLLQRKCSLLESWAASLGVEVSFFLIDE